MGWGRSMATHARAGGLDPKKLEYTALTRENNSIDDRNMLMIAQWEISREYSLRRSSDDLERKERE